MPIHSFPVNLQSLGPSALEIASALAQLDGAKDESTALVFERHLAMAGASLALLHQYIQHGIKARLKKSGEEQYDPWGLVDFTKHVPSAAEEG